jgi:hypothetical protein
MKRIGGKAKEKERSQILDRPLFTEEVSKFYRTSKLGENGANMDFMLCHLATREPAFDVVAAHIVPESLDEEAHALLFGREPNPATDSRNGLFEEAG